MDSLKISDGTTTLDLNDGSAYRLVRWQPSYEGAETIRFEVLGTPTQIAARVRAVENALMLARRRQDEDVGVRWWLQWTPSGLSDEVKAEILDGELQATGQQSRRWELKVERETFWRGSEVSVPVTNGHGTDVTAGLQVDDTDDGSRDNWADIDGDDVVGDMSALTRLVVENSYNVSNKLSVLRVGLRTQESSRLVKNVLENSDAAYIAGSSAGGAYSGGTRHEGTLSGAEITIARWDVSPANARQWSGMWRILTRANFPDEVYIKCTSGTSIDEILNPLDETEPVTSAEDLIDLGILRLPPWRVEEDTPGTFYLVLRAAGTGSWWLDYLLLKPASEGYRKIWSELVGIDYQEIVTDDGINDELAKGDSTRAGQLRGVGRRLTLVPGVDQRIYFSMVSDSGECEIGRTVSLKVEIVPRYRFFES